MNEELKEYLDNKMRRITVAITVLSITVGVEFFALFILLCILAFNNV